MAIAVNSIHRHLFQVSDNTLGFAMIVVRVFSNAPRLFRLYMEEWGPFLRDDANAKGEIHANRHPATKDFEATRRLPTKV